MKKEELEKRKKVIYDLLCDDLYVPMKIKAQIILFFSALISAEISISLDTGAEPVSFALAASIIGRTASISA